MIQLADKIKQKCVCCHTKDTTGYINGMCTDCYDMSLDIGKGLTKKQKADLEKRRSENGYYR